METIKLDRVITIAITAIDNVTNLLIPGRT